MSDMLEKLLGVEKTAAGLVGAAEAEAARRAGQSRQEAQKRHTELLKKTAVESEAAITAEKARVEAERAARNRVENERLSTLPRTPAAFREAVAAILGKGGT